MATPGSVLSPIGMFIEAPSQLGPPSPLLADNIDPVTKDFRDLFVGADPVDDQVQVTAMTRRGSGGSVLDVGVRLSTDKITAASQRILEGDMRLAFQRMTRARDIAFKRISFGYDTGNGDPSGENDEPNATIQINIEYRNLRALDVNIRTLKIVSTPQIFVV